MTRNDTVSRVKVENLYKIFGSGDLNQAYELVGKGESKDEIFAKTGLTIGVKDACFEVKGNEIFVVMGLSGSGKSTLVRMLNRLIEPTSGTVLIEGNDISKLNNEELVQLRRDYMSMVFQSFALLPHLTVAQNAALGLAMAGRPTDEQEKRAMEVLEMVGLKANANSYPSELSGGMQQRVGLARGLATDPDIMLMDEAFSALDPLIRAQMQDELLRIQEENPRTIVFISHDLDEAIRIGDRIAIMDAGEIVQIGTPEEILKDPANDYVRSFFRGVDPTMVFTAREIAADHYETIIRHKGVGPRSALEQLYHSDAHVGYILNSRKQYEGMVSATRLKEVVERSGSLEEAFVDYVSPVGCDEYLQDVLEKITNSEYPVPVVNEDNVYQGAISRRRFLKTLVKSEV
ncbi:MAG: glycine betaine/L-proline ABC transporter ATP-binding protein ProV [Desulfonatronovibrionaceae bacterium]